MNAAHAASFAHITETYEPASTIELRMFDSVYGYREEVQTRPREATVLGCFL